MPIIIYTVSMYFPCASGSATKTFLHFVEVDSEQNALYRVGLSRGEPSRRIFPEPLAIYVNDQ